jgi:protein-disulfide isomerase
MRIKTMLALLLCFGLSQFGYAQAQSQTKDRPQSDLSALRKDVKALQAEQQQIVARLDELKQLLQANGQPVHPPAPSTLDMHGLIFRGDGGAQVAIVEYADFECPYCGQFAREVYPQISDKYIQTGKVKFFYRDLPFHPHAIAAARAAHCAGDQGKYWELHDNFFTKLAALSDPVLLDRAKIIGLDTDKFTECLSSNRFTDDIRKGMSEGQALGIGGTPTFLIGTVGPNDDVVKIRARINGTDTYETFASTLDAALAAKSQEAVSAH